MVCYLFYSADGSGDQLPVWVGSRGAATTSSCWKGSTIYWDFHSLLLGIQMMFSFMLVDDAKPLRLCKHCQKVFISSRANAAFCSARCKNQYNVYKSRGKHKERDGDENA